MDENVKIIVSAVDKASKDLQKIGKAGKTSFTEIQSAIGLANQFLGAAKGFINDTAGATLNYANQVRELTIAIGATPEEASKLIQVADDMGIEFNQLTSALEAGIRKGIKPTVQNIARLSDEYLKLHPGVERTEYLMDKFGRTGQDLARLMELGSGKIEEMGDSIEGTARMMDGKALQAAEDYRIALDNMNDSATDLKITIGQKLIPPLNDFINLANDMMTLDSDDWFKDGADAAAKFLNSLFNLNKEQTTLEGTLKSSTSAAKEQEAIMGDLGAATDIASEAQSGLNSALSDASALMSAYSEQVLFNIASQGLDEKAAIELAFAMGLVDNDTAKATMAVADLSKKYDLNKNGAIDAGKEATLYAGAVRDLAAQIAALQDKTVELTVHVSATGNLTALGAVGKGTAGQIVPGKGGIEQHAAGGIIGPGELGTVGERGWELVQGLPGGGARVFSNSQSQGMIGGGGDTYVTNNIYQLPGEDTSALAARVVAMLSRGGRRGAAGLGYAGA